MKVTDEYLKIQDLKFQSKLKGYTKNSRSLYLLLINEDLSEEEFVLYLMIRDLLTDWNVRHSTYGLFELEYVLLSRHLNWKDAKIRRIFKKLLEKNYCYFVADGKYGVTAYELNKLVSTKDPKFSYYEELKKVISTNKKVT